ncbi:MAG: hypothetical protein CMO59_06220 [Verrucomicrobiales bacterium]|jgi:hypothetical protein|nr:hypothetical protein [Verrucomicrobiales bacterium]MAH35331.1 hypothetical protein [Verrucomicrobiales bacterium]MBT15565.1 hypothetical protein [Verrucomicrobiales bacterium]MED5260765.1 hypothetical protein [Verrucomicrobiota bacterium]|tara:strand:+ start:68 stop:274 length:207 start_codon:yes stop_codon:yes gene_type:complete
MDFLLNENNKPLKVSLTETQYLSFKRIADEKGMPLEDVVSKLILKKLSDKSDKNKRISYLINESSIHR